MKQKIFIFLSGCVFGIVVSLFIGFYCYEFYRYHDGALMGPKVYGNIRILRSKVPDKFRLPDMDSCILIEKDGEEMFSMFFDEDEELDSVSYFQEGEIRFSASLLNRDDKQMCSYGDERYFYFDMNSDGIFDIMTLDGERFIYVPNEKTWLKRSNAKGRDAIVADGDGERVFVFNPEGGWIEKVD